MEIVIQNHTLERALERGALESEILEVINIGIKSSTIGNRISSYKVFLYNDVRNGKHYLHKKVEVIYIEENDRVFTKTVYVYYGKWEI